LKKKKNWTLLPWETTKLLLLMPPKKKPLEIVPIPKTKWPLPIPPKKTPVKLGGITPSSLPHPKKTFLKKRFKTRRPLFLKLHLQLIILSIYLNYPLLIPIETPK
jgi:hypothetical protein